MCNLENKHFVSIALQWRIANGYVNKGGVVVIFNGEVQGWANEVRNPEHWASGCFAINEKGEIWQTIAGNSNDGALMWLLAGNPDL